MFAAIRVSDALLTRLPLNLKSLTSDVDSLAVELRQLKASDGSFVVQCELL